jgi:proteasome assembly chaperone (PAC2) family protein
VRLVDGITREIAWPTNELLAAKLPGSKRDAVVFLGVEPQLKWRTFCTEIIGVARELEVEMVVTLGALLADVAHTRPVRVTGTAADPELVRRLGLQRSRYEGPTGIVGVLHDACKQADIASASLWAAVPHYVAATPSPKATLALVERTTALLASPLTTTDLEIAAASYERQITEVVEADDDVRDYVQRLERDEDDSEHEGSEHYGSEHDGREHDVSEHDVSEHGPIDEASLPSGDALAAELERYLREQRDD